MVNIVGTQNNRECVMNTPLVYPKVVEAFWSFRHALRVVGWKAAFPPLGAF